MQGMIDHLADVMRDEDSALVYEYDLDEVRGLLEEKTCSKAKRRDVALQLSDVPPRKLSGRQGNVLLLVLVNLTENAIEASPPGSSVNVSFCMQNDATLVVKIADRGEGISKELRERLFMPKKSGKDQGSGIGLVISAQLARQIGGELQLLETDESGTTFSVNLPLDVTEG
jgi:signal transduction histidine kinase